MTQKEITALALKFFGLLVLVELLDLFVFYGLGGVFTVYAWLYSPQAFPPGDTTQAAVMVLIAAGAIALPLAVAFFLWRLANTMVDDAKVADLLETGSPPPAPAHSHLVEVMLVGVGIWVAVTALPEVAMSATRMGGEARLGTAAGGAGISADTLVWFASSGLEVALGATLVLARRRWAGLLAK